MYVYIGIFFGPGAVGLIFYFQYDTAIYKIFTRGKFFGNPLTASIGYRSDQHKITAWPTLAVKALKFQKFWSLSSYLCLVSTYSFSPLTRDEILEGKPGRDSQKKRVLEPQPRHLHLVSPIQAGTGWTTKTSSAAISLAGFSTQTLPFCTRVL